MISIRKYLLFGILCLSLATLSSEVQAQEQPKDKKTTGVNIMITQSPKIIVKLEGVRQNACNGESKGAINISAHGGYPPYKYYWSNSDTTQDVAGLRAGLYSVAVYDGFSCSDTLQVEITEPARLVGKVTSVKDILCYGYDNGEIDISVIGGTPPYKYRWSEGTVTEDLKGVNSGRYSVLITDANNCQEIVTADIQEKPLIVRSIDNVDNINCQGENTGSVDITVGGGVPPYTYLWNTGQTTEDLSSLAAGIYQVTVTDSQGCTEVSSTKIIEPDQLILKFDEINNLRCQGDFGGAININVKGGKQPYKYEWSNGANTQDIAGIPAGEYTVKVTDVNGCHNSINTKITEPAALALKLTDAKNVTHNGGSDGAIDLEVGGGMSPYKYKWSNNSTNQDISSLSSGTYTVRVTDASGCSNIMNVTINEPDPLVVKLDNTKNVSCHGDESGEINVSVYGGVKPYKYKWSNEATTEDISSIPAGKYSLTVTDANGFQQIIETPISQPTKFTAKVLEVRNILCHGENTGAVNIDVEGGVQPYRYRWSNGEVSQDLDNLPSGQYSVKILDANHCDLELAVVIEQPEPLDLAFVDFSNIKCTGEATGAIDISVSGGATPYSYQWSNGAKTEDLKGLKADSYSIVVTDGNGCSKELVKKLLEPATLTLVEQAVKNADCNESNTGSIKLNITGGVAPYIYIWNSGDTVLNVSNKPAGTYSLKVTDSNGCTTSFSKTITEPSKLVSTVAEVTNNKCYGNSKGAININVTGGVEPYAYRWSNGTTTQDIVDVKAGEYTVTISDANGCTNSLSAVVKENPVLAADLSITNINCNGQKTGAVKLEVSGGLGPYTYKWSNEATTKDISGLASGNYSVIITDAQGCPRTLDAQITEPPRFVATLESVKHLNCFEEHQGAINVRISGGALPYEYKWNNGATTKDISSLPVGKYTLTATDANGCVQVLTTTLTQPPKISYSIKTVSDVLCNNAKEGAIDISVSGGVGPFTYKWSNGAITQDIQGLEAGKYKVQIADNNGCVNSLDVEVKQPERLTIKLDTTVHILCYGSQKGLINISVTGGVQPYVYSWSNGASTQDIGQLSGGKYTVTVVDAKGCTKSVTSSVREPQPLEAKLLSEKDISCFGDKTGAVTLEVKGGSQPYSFKWSNGSTTQNISGVAAGTYTVDIVDKNGCSQKLTANIKQPSKLVSKLVETKDVSCFNGTDGLLNVTVNGGTAPYRYVWSNEATTQDLIDVPYGNYSLKITDAKGCRDSTIQATLKQPELLQASISQVTEVAKYGQNTGAINIVVSGGVFPYRYSWSNGSTLQNLTQVPGGNYSVQIIDKNGCEKSLTAKISQPPALAVKLISVKDIKCNGYNTGGVTIEASGGVRPYDFKWSNGDSTQNVNNLPAGDYMVTITDASGNAKTLYANIAQPSLFAVKIDDYKNIPCYNDNSGEINVTVTGGVEPYSYKWSSGQTTQDISSLKAGDYTLTIVDGAGCEKTLTQVISQPELFVSTLVDTKHIKCKGESNGQIHIDVKGGVLPYTYYWSNGRRSQDITGAIAGKYSVKVIDANGCTTNLDAVINEPTELIVSIASTEDNNCFGDSKGAITVNVRGGIAPYVFVWNQGSATQNLSDLTAGEYSVNITDANGCAQSLTAVITEPSSLTASVREVINVSCNGQNTGKIYTNVTGGSEPYTYLWDHGVEQQNLESVVAGEYKLTVKDVKGCETTISATISEPLQLAVAADTIYHVLCHGDNKGMVDVTVTGGTRPYSYVWNNGLKTEDLVGVLAGSYSLRVKDAAGCAVNLSAVVKEPELLSLTQETSTDIKCYGQNTGSLAVSAQGGVEPYQYIWNNGSTGESLTNVLAGEYTATVTDKNGCQATYVSTIKQPAALIKTIDAITDIRCNGDSTGSVYVTVRGGVGPYKYNWSNGATTEDIRGMRAGSYQLTITEANGCQSFLEASIEEPTLFKSSVISVNNVDCFGDPNGAISISVSGGVEPYSFVWSNGAQTKDLANINADSYSVMVTDNNGCIRTLYAEVLQPDLMELKIDSVRNVKCCGDDSGAIFITASGGVKPYNYAWSNGATTEDIQNLILGVYTVNITDANGCMVTNRDDMTLYEQVVSQGMFMTHDILFDVGRAVIKAESFIIINKIASFMKEHPDISFRIDGHTDSDGAIALNQQLSEDRAKSIRTALIKFGIRSNRLDYKGFGESKPIASNLTVDGKKQNRRVEFVALTGTLDGDLIENEMSDPSKENSSLE
jgi:outer membrane protein OmpA-like peptidoglycan-associated protein